jgi:hypothetical protein
VQFFSPPFLIELGKQYLKIGVFFQDRAAAGSSCFYASTVLLLVSMPPVDRSLRQCFMFPECVKKFIVVELTCRPHTWKECDLKSNARAVDLQYQVDDVRRQSMQVAVTQAQVEQCPALEPSILTACIVHID